MHSKLAFFAPRDPGYVVDVSGAGIMRSSKHQAAAQKFLAFLVSKQGQEIIGTPGQAPASPELRVPDRVGRDAEGRRAEIQPAAAVPDDHRRARRRQPGGGAAAAGGTPVSAGLS